VKLRFIVLFVSIFSILITQVFAQGFPRVQCGDTITDAFTDENQFLSYIVTLQPGDTIRVTANRFGDYLQFDGSDNVILAPSGSRVAENDSYVRSANIDIASGVLYEPGDYTIQFRNYMAFGAFTFSVSCTRDGGPSYSVLTRVPPETASFSGFGFPGLAPYDLSNILRIPVSQNSTTSFVLATDGDEGIGLRLEGNAGDNVDLSFSRISGNLNLGLIAISENNEMLFQASLVTANSMSTTFILPTSGSYTIAIFRIYILPPAAPLATHFELQVNVRFPG